MRRHITLVPVVLLTTILAACTHGSNRQVDGAAAEEAAKIAKERAFAAQSNQYFEDRLDEPPVTIDAQTLHPKLQYEFQERRKERAKSEINYQEWLDEKWADPEGRAWLREAVTTNWTKYAHVIETPIDTQDISVPGPLGDIRGRVYRPMNAPAGPLPALMYFHGGGYLIASIDAVEPQAKIIAAEAQVVVVSMDYALAPENKFPAAHNDVLAAYDWLTRNASMLGIDPDRIGVGGDSAGANLAIVVSDERARQGLSVPKAQLLYYPFTDTESDRYASFEVFGDGFGLDKNFIRTATASVYENPEDAEHRWMAPLRLANLAKQPSTIVATAGFDPIRDQGVLFAQSLAANGVDVIHNHYPDLNHGFLEASGVIDSAEIACFETARLIGDLLRD